MNLQTSKILLAIALSELSRIIFQGRGVFPYSRLRPFVGPNDFSLLPIFNGLPLDDYSEEQSFFVLILDGVDLRPTGSVISPVCEIRLKDIISLHPVTSSGKMIFNSTQRLPGVVLAEPIFETAWNIFANDRYSSQTLGMAVEFVDEIVPTDLQDIGVVLPELKAGIVANHLGHEETKQTPFSRFIHELLNYRREIDENYGSEQLKFLFIDFFKIVKSSNTPETLCVLGRDYMKSTVIKSPLLVDHSGLITLISDKEFNSIIHKVADHFSCDIAWFHAAILFLCIRLDKQNGKARNLDQYVDAVRKRGVFDLETTRLGLLLVALPESQGSLNEFVHVAKQEQYGIFNLSPIQVSEKARVFENNFFDEIATLVAAKIDEKEEKTETSLKALEAEANKSDLDEIKELPASQQDDESASSAVSATDGTSENGAGTNVAATLEVPAEASALEEVSVAVDLSSDTQPSATSNSDSPSSSGSLQS